MKTIEKSQSFLGFGGEAYRAEIKVKVAETPSSIILLCWKEHGEGKWEVRIGKYGRLAERIFRKKSYIGDYGMLVVVGEEKELEKFSRIIFSLFLREEIRGIPLKEVRTDV